MTDAEPYDPSLSIAVDHRINELCDRFEAALKSWLAEPPGVPPPLQIDELLDQVDASARRSLFRALFVVELHYRRQKGEMTSPHGYASRFPEFSALIEQEFRQANDPQLKDACENSSPPADTAEASVVTPPGAMSGQPQMWRPGDSDPCSGHLQVRCPGCRASIRLASETPITDLICQSCGSHFSLVDQDRASWKQAPLSRLGRFQLIERLGAGGFGSVWRAHDLELDRTVAIKIPRHGSMTLDEQERFLHEARATAQLRHPNIVSVHEIGRDADIVYIVSDLVRGLTLSDWIRAQPLNGREAANLCATIADALHYAHEQGIIHRDLKPANIMVDDEGEPHLMDFGLARREVNEVTITIDGQVLGTPAYMSPEQAQGEAHRADRRSDVYSLGVLLFQLLTGELPFRGNPRMMMHQVIHDDPPSPSKLNSTIAKDLETITLKCLEKAPEQRYGTAAELAAELRRWLSGTPIRARPAGLASRTTKWVKRKPTAALLTTCLAILAIGGPLLAIREARMATHLKGREKALRWSLYVSSIRSAELALKSGREEDLPQLLQDCPIEMRNWEWTFLASSYLQNGHLRSFRAASDSLVEIANCPDDMSLLVAAADGTVTTWDVSTQKLMHRFQLPTTLLTCMGVDWKCGLGFACTDEGVVWKCDLRSGVRERWMSLDAAILACCVCPEKRWLALSKANNEIAVVSYRGAEFSRTIRFRATGIARWRFRDGWTTTAGAGAFAIAFDPTGEHVAAGCVDNVIRVFSTETWKRVAELQGHTGGPWESGIFALAFDADGTRLISGGRDKTVRIWDWEQKIERCQFNGHANTVVDVAFLADSDRVISSSADGSAFLWQIGAPTPLRVLGERTRFVAAVTANARANRVWTAGWDGVVRAAELAPEPMTHTWTAHGGQDLSRYVCSKVAYAPDGDVLASCGRDGWLRIWDAPASRLQEAQFEAPLMSAAFSRDGKRIAVASLEAAYVLDVNSLKIVAAYPIQYLMNTRVALSNDGSTLFTAGVGSDAVLVFDTTTGRAARDPLPLFSRKEDVDKSSKGIMSLALSPSGSQLAAISVDGLVTTISTSGRPSRRTCQPYHSGSGWCVAYGPRDNLLASGAGEIIIWDTDSWRPRHILKGHRDAVAGLVFDRAGNRLYSAGMDGLIFVWDVNSGDLLLRIEVSNLALSGGISLEDRTGNLSVGLHDGRITTFCLLEDSAIRHRGFDPPTVENAYRRINTDWRRRRM